jgi:lipoyl(octanoyl) transferase
MLTSIPDVRNCEIISCPAPVPYLDALEWQYGLVRQRQAGAISDTLLLLEHPPTITLGRGSSESDLLTDESALALRGVSVARVDRGGEITYHAPGQIIGYPILDLRLHGQDLHRYLRKLEDVLIRVLNEYGLTGYRIPGLTGVWVNDAKIAAIGIKVSRWVTMHGFALNIAPDLTPMRRDFVPCGIRDRDVTSLAEQCPEQIPARADVERVLTKVFCQVFSMTPRFAEGQGV